jgi:hypothetical protein
MAISMPGRGGDLAGGVEEDVEPARGEGELAGPLAGRHEAESLAPEAAAGGEVADAEGDVAGHADDHITAGTKRQRS